MKKVFHFCLKVGLMYLPKRNTLGWRYLWTISTIITGVLLLNFVWSTYASRVNEYYKLKEKAYILTEQLVSMRAFIAQNQDRINYDSTGHFEYKHLSPAVVGKGVGDIFNIRTDYSLKQTRLGVRNPENEPDDFEKAALISFLAESNKKEYYGQDVINGDRVFRYIVPLYTDSLCLPCHGGPAGQIDFAGHPKEGLREGDLAGAISVSIPMESYYATLADTRNNMIIFSLILLFATLVGILFTTSRLVVQPLQMLTDKVLQVADGNMETSFEGFPMYGEIETLAGEFSSMVTKLQDFYQNMERKVATRTRQLEVANLHLMERKNALAQLNQKLSENNRYKSEFLATVTHELRTPLTSISAFTELLLDEAMGPLTAEQRENLLDIKTSAQQLMMHISDILDMAKLEAGHLRIARERVDLNDVFRMIRRSMSAIAFQEGVQLDLDRVKVPLVYADPDRLRQIIGNLVANAIKFTKEGGRVHVTVAAEQYYAVIKVTDTGVGIPAEKIPQIFEKFKQGDASMTKLCSGTGLGLALVKLLTEMHEGNVCVESEPGKGSTFFIRIPYKGKEETGNV
jgi:signal transduction histidine kinase